jgi:hypothetical protein
MVGKSDASHTAQSAGQHRGCRAVGPDVMSCQGLILQSKPRSCTSASLSSARASATASSTMACCALFLSRFFTGSYPGRPHKKKAQGLESLHMCELKFTGLTLS